MNWSVYEWLRAATTDQLGSKKKPGSMAGVTRFNFVWDS